MAEADCNCETKIDLNETSIDEPKHEQENHEVFDWGKTSQRVKRGLLLNGCQRVKRGLLNRCAGSTVAIIILYAILFAVIASKINHENVSNNQHYEEILESIQELRRTINATQPISTQTCSTPFPGNSEQVRNDTDYPSWPNESYSLQINQVFRILQNLAQQLESVNNTSSHHFSGLEEVISIFKEEAIAGISKLGMVLAENTDHVKNMSKHVNQLSQSNDERANILNLAAANFSSISSHLVQLSSNLALLNSSQQLHTQNVHPLKETISGLQTQLTSLNELLSRHREDIQGKLSDLDEDLEKLKKDNSAASTERENIKNGISDLKELYSSSVQLYPSVIILINIMTVQIQFYFF